jgi:hypothetical protein
MSLTRKIAPTSTPETFAQQLATRTNFGAGENLTGAPGTVEDAGRLEEGYHAQLADAVYVVVSYGTPIAWEMPTGTWVVPDRSYGTGQAKGTVTRHQNIIRQALSELNIKPTDGI